MKKRSRHETNVQNRKIKCAALKASPGQFDIQNEKSLLAMAGNVTGVVIFVFLVYCCCYCFLFLLLLLPMFFELLSFEVCFKCCVLL